MIVCGHVSGWFYWVVAATHRIACPVAVENAVVNRAIGADIRVLDLCDEAKFWRRGRVMPFLSMEVEKVCAAIVQLDAATDHHFCTLGILAAKSRRRTRHLTEEEKVLFGRYFHDRITGPSHALGLAPEAAMETVRDFARSTTYYYKTIGQRFYTDGECMSMTVRTAGAAGLARKLYYDQAHVLPAVVDDAELYSLTERHMEAV